MGLLLRIVVIVFAVIGCLGGCALCLWVFAMVVLWLIVLLTCVVVVVCFGSCCFCLYCIYSLALLG